MVFARRLALLVATIGIFAISACSEPMAGNIQRAHTCNPEQVGCSGD
jgi:hypothetical protein